jgi:ketosteroid isomerase-like protein
MPRRECTLSTNADVAARVLGYLNFSSGAFDPAVWGGMNELYATVEGGAGAGGGTGEAPDAWRQVVGYLARRLDELERHAPAFRDASQARGVLRLLGDGVLPGYRQFHADLLEHQPPGGLERPYFIMSAAQVILRGGGPWPEAGTPEWTPAVDAAIDQLNDYVGWRPVAVLENGRLSEPYRHERIRPIPLHLPGPGAAWGRYRGLVGAAVDILHAAPSQLLALADFDPAQLEELAIDPRAFDFLHPAASRPNYLFGLWDPLRIDEAGCYRRMVVQQATLDGILSWPDAAGEEGRTRPQLEVEAAGVLAGVILMAAGLSGHGPAARHAGMPLAELLPRIAEYRDGFYRWLLEQLPGDHRAALDGEIARLRQPFGGVRRHINSLLATRRARQVEGVALAGIFARLGRSAAAERLTARVPAASARMLARIAGRVVAAQRELQGDGAGPVAALAALDDATELLFRGVACGALVDPWNILGLGGQFPLHDPGGESLPDPRVDDLVNTTASILEGQAAVWRAASGAGDAPAAARAEAALERLAAWWDRHATTTVSGVRHLSGREIVDSTRDVIGALGRRRRGAPAAAPPGFWRTEMQAFSSPRSHAQAAAELLAEHDLDGAMGLLVHWASLLEGAAMERSGADWLAAAGRWVGLAVADRSPVGRARVRRFLELVEANITAVADCIQQASAGPRRGRAGDGAAGRGAGADDGEEPADGEERVAAAYESMVWHDSADDGHDGGMLDVEGAAGAAAGGLGELEGAAELVGGVCRLLRQALAAVMVADAAAEQTPADARPEDRLEHDSLVAWRHSLQRFRRALVAAAEVVAVDDAGPAPGTSPGDHERSRWQRDATVERLVDAAVQATETGWLVAARLHMLDADSGRSSVGRLFAALARGDAAAVRAPWDRVRQRLVGRPVLYVPLSRGGRPGRIVRARCRERLLERLAAALPRVGLVADTSAVVQLAKALESRRPPGAASVSEFDRVFEAATTALVERIVESAGTAVDGQPPAPEVVTARILEGLSLLVPRLLETWMTHARQLRLSVLERVRDPKTFAGVRDFIERYGAGLFTQHLLAPAALRGVLRGGVASFLQALVEEHAGTPDLPATGGPRRPTRLLTDLDDGSLPLRQAAGRIRLVLEAVAENHAEYRDWNSTTTQSDRGECLHVLLDFLRLKAEYERIAWTLRPVNMAHRVLARRGATAAAEAWRGRMREETRETASDLVGRLTDLEARCGVRLASVSDRIRRPFTAVLEQDELEALVPPAVAELVGGRPGAAGAALEARAESFLGVAGGSGVEVPEWCERLAVTVDRALEGGGPEPGVVRADQLPEALPWQPLAWADLVAALST